MQKLLVRPACRAICRLTVAALMASAVGLLVIGPAGGQIPQGEPEQHLVANEAEWAAEVARESLESKPERLGSMAWTDSGSELESTSGPGRAISLMFFAASLALGGLMVRVILSGRTGHPEARLADSGDQSTREVQ